MATPPFVIDETIPAPSDIISQHPANAQAFRDVVESWLNTITTNTTGLLKAGGFPTTLNLTGKTFQNLTLTTAAVNGSVGATTPSTGAFTTITASGTIVGSSTVQGAGVLTTGNFSRSAAGTLNFRPSGNGSTTGQMTLTSAGLLTVPSATVSGAFTASGTSTLTGAVSAGSTLAVTGLTTLTGGLAAGTTVTGTAATPLIVERTNVDTNTNIQFKGSTASVYVGLTSSLFAVGSDANLSTVANRFFDVNASALTVRNSVVFTGNGSGLTQLDASNVSSGTLADARLPSSMANKTFTGTTSFPNSASIDTLGRMIAGNGVFSRPSAGQMNFRPNGVASTSNEATLDTSGLFTATSFSGAGGSLTGLNASNVSTGTLADARLPGSMAGKLFTSRVTYAGTTGTANPDASNGILARAAAMNTTSQYTPGFMFGSSDSDFTTTSPKTLAGIFGRATQTYSADNTGGMAMDFFVSPNTPGTGDNFTLGMTLTSAGLDVTGALTATGTVTAAGGSMTAALDFPNATVSTNGITVGTSTNQTQINNQGVFARNGGQLHFRPNGSGSTTGQMTVATSGNVTINGTLTVTG